MLLAKYFDWDGAAILEATACSLEDANFHVEGSRIRKQIPKLGIVP